VTVRIREIEVEGVDDGLLLIGRGDLEEKRLHLARVERSLAHVQQVAARPHHGRVADAEMKVAATGREQLIEESVDLRH